MKNNNPNLGLGDLEERLEEDDEEPEDAERLSDDERELLDRSSEDLKTIVRR